MTKENETPVIHYTDLERITMQLNDLSARHLAQTVKLKEAQIAFETEQGKLNRLGEELAVMDAKYIAQEKYDSDKQPAI